MKNEKVKKSGKLSRRDFLKKSAAASTVFAVPTIVPSLVFGANAPSNRITMGCVGMGGQGTWNMDGFLHKPGAVVLAVCDVNKRSDDYDKLYQFPHSTAGREPARQMVERYYGQQKPSGTYKGCDSYADFRDLLARDDIDTVLVSAPDHWHVPISLAAVKAGKDVYCEKPLSLNIGQGRVLSDAVKRFGRVLQTGTQSRSDGKFRFACELIRNGRIGKLHTIKIQLPPNNCFCGTDWQPMPVPKGLDYDMWLGPAPWEPYTRKRCHYRFRFILDYSGGQITNFGAHIFDIVQWANDSDNTGPVEIKDHGSQFPETGLFTTSTRVDIEYTYANGVKMFCKTGDYGARFEGSQGWILISPNKFGVHPASLLESKIGPNEIHLYESGDHKVDFLNCGKSRRQPAATVEIGHRSATVCHLGNIAMLLGEKLNWDPEKERFVNNEAANRMLTQTMRSPWRL